jgi:hypothetical protein
MNRRDILKSLAAIPASVVLYKDKEVGRALKVESNARYIVFLNAEAVDIDEFANHPGIPLPQGTPLISVFGDMENAVRIYKVNE